ncbi:protein HYPER-SENSITIVITY-RELATED 4-like isoform X2 [Telopea speciosissima]|uniref:protein HYPER-SENSITIVITY-RELATED 4-like isoform X2 n=1 Tax=Telopea speciosissima TaxID=54955 RepID=UPI001CC600CA|nr:protein HYPER-SENSITIVITY-RELATED 4-like isoform X2 [Telopea speciosissima]
MSLSFSPNTTNMASITKTLLPMAASLAASAMLVRTIMRDFLPHEVQDYIFSGLRKLINNFSSQQTIVIEEFDELTNNQIYEAVEIYLGNKVSPSNRQTLRISKSDKEKNIKIAMGRNEEIVDTFDGIQFKWRLVCRQVESKVFHNPRDLNSTFRSEIRSFEFNFHKKYKDMVFDSYLPHILKKSKSMKEENKTVKLFTVKYERVYHNLGDTWSSVNLDHPATFETLAMDMELKRKIMEDLERFVQRREFYRRVGKAWKRGYLLYGPPGTGKSSLIAAMANYLNFDIYDLELTDLRCNSELRRLLLATANRSILVVEDIDCTIELQDRLAKARAATQPLRFHEGNQVTLSGLLNFTDGLWSSCGDERIIVFTTNHKDRLDQALLRPGRMDMHVHMSFCTPCGFKLLAFNYLQIHEHELFQEIEELIEKVKVTPAAVAEELMKNENPKIALEGLIELLRYKKEHDDEVNTAEPEIEAQDQQEKEDLNMIPS